MQYVGIDTCNNCQFGICDNDCSLGLQREGPSPPASFQPLPSRNELFPPGVEQKSALFSEFFPNAKLMLCSWHLRQRVTAKIREAFAGEHVKRAEDLFDIYENSSSTDEGKLAERLYQLVEHALQHGRDAAKAVEFIQYLSKTEWPRHRLHVFAFTASTGWSFRIRSTQRAESSNR